MVADRSGRALAALLGALVSVGGLAGCSHGGGLGRDRAQTEVAPAVAGAAPRRFALELSVRGIPDAAVFVPLSARIDLDDELRRLGVEGPVDEASFRLALLHDDGREEEVPLQVEADPRSAPTSRRLPPGRESVSYLAELPAGETPEGGRFSGRITWGAKAVGSGPTRYRLEFAVPVDGSFVQVPYEPRDLKHFDVLGRASERRWFPCMQVHPHWPLGGRLDVSQSPSLVASYHIGPGGPGASETSARRPYVYPLMGLDGTSLTELGKTHDPTGSHAHHDSLWVAHANVQGEDFWSERGGIQEHDGLERLDDGPVFCRISQRTKWTKDGEPFLVEGRTLRFYAQSGDSRLVDVELSFRPPAGRAVEFGETPFGFLSLRVAPSISVFDGGGEILNGAGDLNEQEAHRKRAPWIDLSGPVSAGKWGGIAILDHPSNPRYPTRWHCRNDGWAGASFTMVEPYLLEPGEELRLLYRLVLHRGNAAAAGIAARHAEFGAEPEVSWGDVRPLGGAVGDSNPDILGGRG